MVSLRRRQGTVFGLHERFRVAKGSMYMQALVREVNNMLGI